MVAALTGLLLAEPAAAAASTLYVDKNDGSCSDSGDGTASDPFCSIVKAASVATAGQTVLVSSGTYSGQVSVGQSGTSSDPIVFQPASGAAVTVTSGTGGFRVSSKSWITIKGFTVANTADRGIYVTGSSHVTVQGNDVSGSGDPSTGNTAAGIKLSDTSDSLVLDNTSHANSDYGINLSSSPNNQIRRNVTSGNAREIARAAAGIFLSHSALNVVDSNTSHHNEDSGISLWDGSNGSVASNNVVYNNGDHGIDVLSSTGVSIVSNTVYKSVDSGIEMQGGAGAALANNIVVDNGINSPRTAGNIRVVDSPAQTTLDFDLVFLSSDDDLIDYLGTSYSSLAAFQAATGKEPNGKQGDPKFVNPGAGDFNLQTGSPAIDSANSGAPNQPPLDHDGKGRFDDTTTQDTGVGPRTFDDRGAFEFVASK